MTKNIYKDLSEERKQLQEQGLIPEWYTTAGWQLFKGKYLYEADNVKEQFQRIARTAAKHLAKIGKEEEGYEKFFNMLWKGWLSCSTPVLANMGTDRGLNISCSGSVVDDSIDGFYSTRREIALLTKYGFGTSSYLGDIRPRGSPISVGGKAAGVLPVFKGLVQDMREVSQGGTRRGSCASYLPMHHGDFDELADHILSEPDDANVGWNVADNFIQNLNIRDEDSNRRFQKSLKLKMVTGKGYYFFVDKANRKRPEAYKKHNLLIKNTNLCLTGDSIIDYIDRSETDHHSIRLDDLVDNFNNGLLTNIKISSYDGTGRIYASISDAKLTGIVDELYEIDAGYKIRCTADHKIYTKNRGYVAAKDLILGDILMHNQLYAIEAIVCHIEKLKVEPTKVYDLTVPATECFFANGILVHNCSEIMLFNDKNHTYTCVLSSMNVFKYDEWKDTDAVYWATIFLDCVVEEFLERARSISGLEKAVRFTEKGRALGLGQCGFHTYLQAHMIPFESLDAHMKNNEICCHIWEESLKASQWLAGALGEPEWCEGLGIRNTHRLAIAPTKSTALLMGGISEGINPDPAMTYTQSTAGGEIDRINPILLEIMKAKGIYSKSTLKQITNRQGSVQHVTWLTDEEKQVFKTAYEINQEAILRLASARARYLDQWQSLNLFFAADESPARIAHIHKLAFEDENILALYYIYTQAGVQAANEGCEACQ